MPSDTQKFVPTSRLVFQGSIPFDDPSEAEVWYNMLKEMVKHKSDKSTLNGQVTRMLEPCCGDRPVPRFSPGVGMHRPAVDR